MQYNIKCVICGATFEAIQPHSKYCSPPCRQVGIKKRSREGYLRFKANNPDYKKKYHKQYRIRHPDKYKEQLIKHKLSARDIKERAITHYSNGTVECNVCGVDDIRVLLLHHSNGGGNAHRKSLGLTEGYSTPYYRILSEIGYPEGIEVLCANCHAIRHYTD